jgi:hypothetical protein
LGTLAAPLPPDQHEPSGRSRRRRGYAEGMWVELLHGLHARLMLRTYRDSVGPRFHGEALMLPLLPAGHVVWLARRPGSRRMRDRFE